MKKVLLSGVQPSGKIHIGNYFGAIKQFVELQEKYECYIFIANYHALTSVHDADKLRSDVLETAMDYLACGLDPEKITLFIQSDVPEVTELNWIFNNLVTVPYLSRAVAYKDKTAQGIEATVGLFDYPVLMAADILLPGANVVPVGADQKQHVEIARDIAQKFNITYGETFEMPEALIQGSVSTVPGIDGRKMSKSYGNTIPLFATKEEIIKQVMAIVTDSSGKRPENVYAIHKLFRDEESLVEIYEKNAGKYKALKEALIEDIETFIAPMRAKRMDLEDNKDYVMNILRRGGRKAKAKAEEKMEEIRKKVGLTD